MNSFIKTAAAVLACLAMFTLWGAPSAAGQPAGPVPALPAGGPPARPLNPEPPDSYTCTPRSDSTVCHSDTSDVVAPSSIGFVCGAGDGVFAVTRRVKAMRLYDANGDLVKRVQETITHNTLLCNPATRASVSSRQHDIDTDILATPGDLSTAMRYSVESLIATGPDHRVLLVDKGRTVYAADGSVVSRTGRRDFDAYFAGNAAIVARLHAAIGG
jgi:hypothetical protein